MRAIESGTSPAALNMAADESLFVNFDSASAEPVLRLYGWDRPCISLGYFQKANDAIRKKSCEKMGVDVVRRITGGRAVLHDQEVTYCVVASSRRGPFAGQLLDCYRAIADCLSAGCEALGLDRDKLEVVTGRGTGGRSDSAACFMMTSAYEILVGGRKLIGSAQKRGDGAFVQHGSIPLRIDMALARSVMHLDGVSGELSAVQGPVCLEEAVGRRLDYEEVRHAIARGFASCLGTSIELSDMNEGERKVAEKLARDKYSLESWTYRR
ncbi:MAG TPA: biotin/lipoate A/B protein ligase family protein [bacterium]|nr:biotin/lipoate A/B protein ligase family protein [bacterium]